MRSGQIVPRNLAGGNSLDIDRILVEVTRFLLRALTALWRGGQKKKKKKEVNY